MSWNEFDCEQDGEVVDGVVAIHPCDALGQESSGLLELGLGRNHVFLDLLEADISLVKAPEGSVVVLAGLRKVAADRIELGLETLLLRGTMCNGRQDQEERDDENQDSAHAENDLAMR